MNVKGQMTHSNQIKTQLMIKDSFQGIMRDDSKVTGTRAGVMHGSFGSFPLFFSFYLK